MIELYRRMLGKVACFNLQNKGAIDLLLLPDVRNEANDFQFNEFLILSGEVKVVTAVRRTEI